MSQSDIDRILTATFHTSHLLPAEIFAENANKNGFLI
jgi:hypothetical protein